uniref:Uncharacterized protein n=1 Tax=Romanomermis culicivorax TaxID=13658 RepID=A0A915K9N6_ROMCU
MDLFKPHQSFVEKHMCAGVVAIENLWNRKANNTYYELTDGRDYVRASKNHPNIFEIGNGEKDVVGGSKDDVFLLIGSRIKGQLNGGYGSNLLSLSDWKFNGTINVTDRSLVGISNVGKAIPMIRISNFDQIHGRPKYCENVQVWCSLRQLHTLGGSKLSDRDRILIPFSTTCRHQLTMTIYPNTEVDNKARYGHFQYHIKEMENGRSNISIHSCKSIDSQHLITFEYNFFDFSSVRIHYHLKPIELIFTKEESSSISVNVFSLENFNIAFKDGVQFHLHKKHFLAVLTTAQNLTMVENFYADIISASTISMIIHSELSNETLTLSRGQHHGEHGQQSVNIHHSDKNGKSHFKGNEHQNIFAISPYFEADCAKFHDVSIHLKEGSKNLIDYSHVRRAVVGLSSEVTFKVAMEHPDHLIIHALYTNESGTVHCDRNIGQVKVNMTNSTNLVLMNKGPLRLKFKDNQPYLESPPIHFNQSKNIIILSDHDIEGKTEIILDKNLGANYTFYTQNSTLLLTNVVQTNDSCEMLESVSDDSFAVLIMDYTSSKAMQSLILKFNDVAISVNDNVKGKVGAWEEFAASFDVMKCIWRSILRLPASEGAIVEVNTQVDDQGSELQEEGQSEYSNLCLVDYSAERSLTCRAIVWCFLLLDHDACSAHAPATIALEPFT